MLENAEEILSEQICGFHQYVLEAPVHLSFVSQNLCKMLGVSPEALLDDKVDCYLHLIDPRDRKKYKAFLQHIILEERTASAEYRLLKKDGTSVYVRDTISPTRTAAGILMGSSVLSDIGDIKNEQNDLRPLNHAAPFGFMRYTCEKQPKITYMSPQLIEFFRFPKVKEGEINYLEMFKNNIFLMIPMQDRQRFAKYLSRVDAADAPVAGDIDILRCDGTRAHIFGWVIKTTDKQGNPEFQSVIMDITERYQAKKQKENEHYLQALSEVYDRIFEFNLAAQTIKCVHCEDQSYFKAFENIAVQIKDVLDKWLISSVVAEQKDEVYRFFKDFCRRRLSDSGGKPLQISYRVSTSDHSVKSYTGIFIKIDSSVSLFCCRQSKTADTVVALKAENNRLKDKMRSLVMKFSDGIAAFEILPNSLVKPLYSTENIYEFFGYTEKEWLPLTQKYTPLEDFVAHSKVGYQKFADLLRTGEARFSYFDFQSQTQRSIKAICSEKEPNIRSPRYVMLYEAEPASSGHLRTTVKNDAVSIRTFGYFDVFVGDTPIAFRSKKSKELFALLVDRKGGYVSSEEAIGFLWEDESANTLTYARYRKVALRLKSTLEEYGIADIVEAVDGKRRLVADKVDCDLYRYLSGKKEYSRLFKGNYLSNYSWAETTLGELINSRTHAVAQAAQ